jgi:hypothetical protein
MAPGRARDEGVVEHFVHKYVCPCCSRRALNAQAEQPQPDQESEQLLLTHRLSTVRLWVYLGDAAHPCNVFDFTINRKRDGPQRFLTSFSGYLHAHAFSGYDGLYLPDPRSAAARIVEVACNAHARRKFYEARGSDALRSHQALAYYRQLYELGRAAKDFSDAQRLQTRQDLAVPILEQVHKTRLPMTPDGQQGDLLPDTWQAVRRPHLAALQPPARGAIG